MLMAVAPSEIEATPSESHLFLSRASDRGVEAVAIPLGSDPTFSRADGLGAEEAAIPSGLYQTLSRIPAEQFINPNSSPLNQGIFKNPHQNSVCF